MCGRVILTLSAKMIEAILNDTYGVQLSIDDFIPRYNITPGQTVLSIIEHKSVKRAGFMKWQYVPDYAESIKDGFKFINARSETVFEKISYKDSFYNRRCIVLCDGFYEWKRPDKLPYFFHHNRELFAIAGIWKKYNDHYGFSVITTEANDVMKPIHHRMPVIIKEKDISKWLNPETDLITLKSMMRPVEDAFFTCYPVSQYVNNSRNDGPNCIKAV